MAASDGMRQTFRLQEMSVCMYSWEEIREDLYLIEESQWWKCCAICAALGQSTFPVPCKVHCCTETAPKQRRKMPDNSEGMFSEADSFCCHSQGLMLGVIHVER